jgi:clan AA aspartic protease
MLRFAGWTFRGAAYWSRVMTGSVDDSGRALVRIRLKNPSDATETELDAWIDTGFTGELVLPQQNVVSLGLPLGPAVMARLATGSDIQLDTYTCLLEWFDEWKRIEVVANQGQYPLLGVGLLLDHDLHIDYRAKTIAIG